MCVRGGLGRANSCPLSRRSVGHAVLAVRGGASSYAVGRKHEQPLGGGGCHSPACVLCGWAQRKAPCDSGGAGPPSLPRPVSAASWTSAFSGTALSFCGRRRHRALVSRPMHLGFRWMLWAWLAFGWKRICGCEPHPCPSARAGTQSSHRGDGGGGGGCGCRQPMPTCLAVRLPRKRIPTNPMKPFPFWRLLSLWLRLRCYCCSERRTTGLRVSQSASRQAGCWGGRGPCRPQPCLCRPPAPATSPPPSDLSGAGVPGHSESLPAASATTGVTEIAKPLLSY